MRVVIDPDRCQGHSRCWALAPDIFDVDDYGNSSVKIDGSLTADEEDAARLAIANCPERAISFAENASTQPDPPR